MFEKWKLKLLIIRNILYLKLAIYLFQLYRHETNKIVKLILSSELIWQSTIQIEEKPFDSTIEILNRRLLSFKK